MIDHVSISVSDLAKSAAFYESLLAPLGYTKMVAMADRAGFGKRFPEVWLNARPRMIKTPDDTGMHLCLRAKSEAAVQAFHQAAIDGGGRSDGAPGARQAALTMYYAAFVRDPDGNKLEAATFPAQPGGGFA
ncbi:MAG: VOC family protein [Hyphomonadaceae bacterium]